MRLFIAIRFEKSILDPLIKLQDDLRDMGVKGNYTKHENLHLTLAFIGEYKDPGEVLDVMEQIEFTPFDIELDGVGSFGDIFWAGISDNPELSSYVKRLRHELAENGIPFDKKKFSPHITLIRKAFYRDHKMIPVSDPPKGRMTVSGISLMKSERGKNGMIYTEL